MNAILLTIRDGSGELIFIRTETGNTVTADDAAREGFAIPPQHTQIVLEALLALARDKALA